MRPIPRRHREAVAEYERLLAQRVRVIRLLIVLYGTVALYLGLQFFDWLSK